MAEIDRELIFTHYANDSPVGEKTMKMFIQMTCSELQHALKSSLLHQPFTYGCNYEQKLI